MPIAAEARNVVNRTCRFSVDRCACWSTLGEGMVGFGTRPLNVPRFSCGSAVSGLALHARAGGPPCDRAGPCSSGVVRQPCTLGACLLERSTSVVLGMFARRDCTTGMSPARGPSLGTTRSKMCIQPPFRNSRSWTCGFCTCASCKIQYTKLLRPLIISNIFISITI